MDKTKLRNEIASLPAMDGDTITDDNIAIVLASYFSSHPDRPKNDEIDDEVGWGVWVMEKTDDALDRIVAHIGKD